MEVQCLLLLEVLGGSHKHAVNGAVKKFTKLWREVTGGSQGWWALLLPHCPPLPSDTYALHFPQNPGLVDQYLSAILSLEPNQSYAGMLGLLVQFCTSHKELDVVNQHKASGLTEGEDQTWFCPGGPSCWPYLKLVHFLT